MWSDIFEKWLKSINNRFRVENRKILLFIDNVSSHFNPDENEQDNLSLSHIRIKFLLLNITAYLQLMDVKIINSFKAIYKQHYI